MTLLVRLDSTTMICFRWLHLSKLDSPITFSKSGLNGNVKRLIHFSIGLKTFNYYLSKRNRSSYWKSFHCFLFSYYFISLGFHRSPCWSNYIMVFKMNGQWGFRFVIKIWASFWTPLLCLPDEDGEIKEFILSTIRWHKPLLLWSNCHHFKNGFNNLFYC